jgi:hypothetical protein
LFDKLAAMLWRDRGIIKRFSARKPQAFPISYRAGSRLSCVAPDAQAVSAVTDTPPLHGGD